MRRHAFEGITAALPRRVLVVAGDEVGAHVRQSAAKYSGGVYQSEVAPIAGSCSALGLHFLIEPVVRPTAS